ncbi:Ribonuclease H-like domain [Phytophthora cactorum]|nr:Ribonuclease H-like domain [Phytophthora cactorum]
MRAWIGADLAVPDLRTELIAMTGSTVARWALLGTHGPHIVQIRDVLHWCGDDRGRLESVPNGAGIPGPGGSGSVVLRVGSDLASLDLCWVGSMSYGSPRMINNTAELLDLLMGLRACMGHGWMPLHVVGDSNLFLRQQRLRIPPKATHLRGLYYQSQMTADQLIVFSWQNHYREVNKMADILANMLPRGYGSTGRWASAFEHAANDVGHWLSRNSDEDLSRTTKPCCTRGTSGF